ncbi:MAG: c-type cytochrome [Thermoanaerobaculia bacterium]
MPRRSIAFWTLLLALPVAALAGCRQRRLPEVDTSNQSLAAGRRVFERRCASCHNSNGDGDTVTASRFPYANLLDGKWRGHGSLASIERQIREGHDPMPKFEGKLTDQEIRDAAGYVLALAAAAAKAKR